MFVYFPVCILLFFIILALYVFHFLIFIWFMLLLFMSLLCYVLCVYYTLFGFARCLYSSMFYLDDVFIVEVVSFVCIVSVYVYCLLSLLLYACCVSGIRDVVYACMLILRCVYVWSLYYSHQFICYMCFMFYLRCCLCIYGLLCCR